MRRCIGISFVNAGDAESRKRRFNAIARCFEWHWWNLHVDQFLHFKLQLYSCGVNASLQKHICVMFFSFFFFFSFLTTQNAWFPASIHITYSLAIL